MEIKEKPEDIRIEGVIQCLTPLSHIGEVHSIGSFFNMEEILSNNEWVKVPKYTGNALRGMLRREARNYLCNALGCKLNEEWLSKLSFGGGASETNIIDVQKRSLERKFFPMLSIFGYGLGSMSGKISPSALRLICKETADFIPEKYIRDMELIEASEFLGNEAFTRMDDFKDDIIVEEYLDKTSIEVDEKTGKRKLNAGETTVQMIYETEVIKTGAKWYCRFDLKDVTATELGCFLQAIIDWSRYSRLGGMHNKGYGLVKSTFDFINFSTGTEINNFIVVNTPILQLSEKAEEYQKKYDTFIKDVIIPLSEKYTGFLQDKNWDIVKMLKGETK